MATTANDGNPAVRYRARHDPSDGPVSEAVVAAVAAVESVDPVELDARLYDSVDPEALDRLYETAAERSDRFRVSFVLAGHEVVVTGDAILVRESGGPTAR